MDLRDYLAVLRRRRGLVVLATLVVLVGTLVLTQLQTPVYAAHARVLLQPSKTVFEGGSSQASTRVDTEIQIFESVQVRNLVQEKRGTAPRATVTQVGQTEVVDVSAESTDPREAAEIANAYASSYIEFRRKQAIDSLLAAGEEIQKKVDALQKPIDELAAAANAATAAAAANRQAGTPAPAPVVNPDREALVAQQALFKQRLNQLQVDAALKDGGAQLVGPATTPTAPVRPRPAYNALLALGAGLALGLAAAFTLDHLDDSMKSGTDLEHAAPGVSLLAVIPRISQKNTSKPGIVSLTEPTSPGAEAYRTLRTSVTFQALDRKLTVIQVTSPSSSEGKTTTATNLAVAMAKAGQRVMLVDCDLRRPRIHDHFDLPNEVGFTSVLLGSTPLATAMQQVGTRLWVLTAGPRPANPSELLSSARTSALLTSMSAQADFVLIDCPPALPVTDAAALSAKVDGTLLVVKAGTTSTKELTHTMELLRRVEAPVMGIVLNGATSEGVYGYSYYGYQYGLPSENDNGSGNRNGHVLNGSRGAMKRQRGRSTS